MPRRCSASRRRPDAPIRFSVPVRHACDHRLGHRRGAVGGDVPRAADPPRARVRPGGLADITFRLVADKLTGLVGKQVVVENQPGAGGVAAANTVMKAAPDGHTLLVLTNGTAISKGLFKSLPFDPVKDFAPVSLVAYFDLVIVTSPESKYQSLGDLSVRRESRQAELRHDQPRQHAESLGGASSTAGIDVAIVPFRTSTPRPRSWAAA
jgi:tripartite-type tricarboxylate transporter receptor subunit TctC